MANQVRILLTLDGKQYEADLSVATTKTKQFGQEAERAGTRGTALASAMRALGIGFSAFTAVQVIKQISQTGIAFEQMRLALKSISADTGEAAQRFQFVAGEAERLGVDIETAVQGYTRLAAATRGTNLEGEETARIFSAVSEASARLSLSTADAAGVMRALAQIASKGTLSAEELRQQLGDRLPGAFQIAADAMGVTTAKLNDMLQKGEIASEEFLPKFADAMRRAFSTDSRTRIDSTQASFSRLVNEIKLTADGISKYLNPVLAATADALVAANRARRGFFDSRPEGSQDLGDGRYVTSSGYLVDPTRASMNLRLPVYTGGEPGLQAPYRSQFDTTMAGFGSQFAGQQPTPPEPAFYGSSPPPALDEKQQERVDLLREELALIGVLSEEEKARYQITEGRYKNETRQAKELILELAKEADAQKRRTEAEREAKKAAEEYARETERLQQTYDPTGQALRQLTMDQIALHDRLVAGKISWEEYQRAIEGVSRAYQDLGTDTQDATAMEQARQDLMSMGFGVAEQAVNVLRTIGGQSKGMAMVMLAIETAMGVARVRISTEVAAMRAIADLGPIAGNAMAAQIRALGAVSTGLILASGAIQAGQISGGRERGGPVDRGRLYEVGERGKPELLESGGRYYLIPGQNGQVAPAKSAGGSGGRQISINIDYNIDASNNDPASMAHLIRVVDDKVAQSRLDIREAIQRGEFE